MFVEAAFYLCFPVLVPALRRMSFRAQVELALGLVVASATAQVFLHRAALFAIGYSDPLVYLPVFVVGIVVALRARQGGPHRWRRVGRPSGSWCSRWSATAFVISPSGR